MVAKEPMSVRFSKAKLAFLKALFWPVLLVAFSFCTYEGAQRLLLYIDWPITRISVHGNLSHICQQTVQQRIGQYITTSFFTIDLAGIRVELKRIPWVAHAEVYRIWPDQVVICLEEQLPVASWGDSMLLNNHGQAFVPCELTNYKHLPHLFGPQLAQQQVIQQYQALSQILQPLGFSIARLELRERGSWFLTTAASSYGPGIELLLGRDRLVEKMRRFIVIYNKTLKKQIINIASVDLRYANGLAVGWREPSASTIAKPAIAKN
uniref:cell division protein FtsQ/DivIB n=1 Tax=Candidatus Pseudomonas adelgestsugas TaxID=1302376 RepID=UPI00100EC268|nr:cell division protein FtsQ/DivIB [Candidatus Pseudomonas adelgestsugas]